MVRRAENPFADPVLTTSDPAPLPSDPSPVEDLRVLQAVYAALLAFNRLERARQRDDEAKETLSPPYIIRHGPQRPTQKVDRETGVALRLAKRFLSRTALYGLWLAAGLTAAVGLLPGCSAGAPRAAATTPFDANRERLRQDLAFLSSIPVADCPELPASPPPATVRTHTVKAGETLWRIASACGIEVRELQRKNGIADPGSLKVGQVLVLPGAPTPIETGPMADSRPVPTPGPAAGASRPATSTADAGFRWPINGRVIADHGIEGVDISADAGEAVTAVRAGTVSFVSDRLQGYGKTVVLSHPDGYQSFYAYNGEILVQTGDVVRQGDTIARAGSTGRAERPTLHFRLFREGTPVDAVKVMR